MVDGLPYIYYIYNFNGVDKQFTQHGFSGRDHGMRFLDGSKRVHTNFSHVHRVYMKLITPPLFPPPHAYVCTTKSITQPLSHVHSFTRRITSPLTRSYLYSKSYHTSLSHIHIFISRIVPPSHTFNISIRKRIPPVR